MGQRRVDARRKTTGGSTEARGSSGGGRRRSRFRLRFFVVCSRRFSSARTEGDAVAANHDMHESLLDVPHGVKEKGKEEKEC